MTAEIKIPWTTKEVVESLGRIPENERCIVKGFIAGRRSANPPAPAPTTRREA